MIELKETEVKDALRSGGDKKRDRKRDRKDGKRKLDDMVLDAMILN